MTDGISFLARSQPADLQVLADALAEAVERVATHGLDVLPPETLGAGRGEGTAGDTQVLVLAQYDIQRDTLGLKVLIGRTPP